MLLLRITTSQNPAKTTKLLDSKFLHVFVSIASTIEKLLQNINCCNYLPTFARIQVTPMYLHTFFFFFADCIDSSSSLYCLFSRKFLRKIPSLLKFHFMSLSKILTFPLPYPNPLSTSEGLLIFLSLNYPSLHMKE